jgi:diguanylate cyclase (GGDEF)-like protein
MSRLALDSARGFLDFGEATATVMDLLEKQLCDCDIFITALDPEAGLLRIVDARGAGEFKIAQGQTLPLPPNKAAEGASLDPAQALLQHPEFAQVRSYVGIPLELEDGSVAGTLCAIANRTERFQHNELELLRVMARVLVNEIERERKEQDMRRRQENLRRSNRRLKIDSLTDPLTGVANRRAFDSALVREWKLAKRGTVDGFLLLIDLDDFKSVNDRFGHSVGDDVLRACGAALADSARDTDIVSRIGGDEFAVILVGCSTAEEVAAYRDRARVRFAELLAETPARVTFATGHQSLAEASAPLRAIELADQAMYWHKRRRQDQGHPIHAERTDTADEAVEPERSPERGSRNA